MQQLTDKELQRRVSKELSDALGIEPIYMLKDFFFMLKFKDESLHEKFGHALCVPTEFWHTIIDSQVRLIKDSETTTNELRAGLDQHMGIRPDCGHEWKYTEARGDEFESCLQCRVDKAEKRLQWTMAKDATPPPSTPTKIHHVIVISKYYERPVDGWYNPSVGWYVVGHQNNDVIKWMEYPPV